MPRTQIPIRLAAYTLLTVSALAWAYPAQAFRMIQNTSTGRVTSGNLVGCNDPGGFVHWTSPFISWYHNTAGQGSGKANALKSAMASWTNVSNASHSLSYAGTTTAGWSIDSRNTLLWTSSPHCSGCLAITGLVLQTGQEIVEVDIEFNEDYSWTTDGTNYDTETVAAHELGHALGIHHTDVTSTPRPTMYATYFGSGGRSLEPDDRSALQCAESRYPFFAPATPSSLDVNPAFCFGVNDLSWSSSNGADFYELYGSTSSSFSSQWLEYSGPDTFRTVDVSTTTYFRVRACNSAGCSGYREGDQAAIYYNGCL